MPGPDETLPSYLEDATDVTEELLPDYLEEAEDLTGRPVEKVQKLGPEETVTVTDELPVQARSIELAMQPITGDISEAEAGNEARPFEGPTVHGGSTERIYVGDVESDERALRSEGYAPVRQEVTDTDEGVSVESVLQTPQSYARRGGLGRDLPHQDDPDRMQLGTSDEVPLSAYSPGVAMHRAVREGDLPAGLDPVAQFARSMNMNTGSYSPTAMMMGGADVITQGFADELGGAIRSAQRGTDYAQERGGMRREMSEAAGRNPGSYALGTVGGVAAMAGLPSPAAARSLQGPGNAGLRIGAAIGEGTALGALNAAGRSEADVGTADFGEDVAEGGVVGGATAGGVQGAGEGLIGFLRRRYDPQALRDCAAAFRIRGRFGDQRPTIPHMQQVIKGELSNAPEADAALRRWGVHSIDEAADGRERAGTALDSIASSIDQQARSLPGYREQGGHVLNPERIAARFREYAERLRRNRNVDDSVIDSIERQAQSWQQRANEEPLTFRRAWQFTQGLRNPQNWRRDAGGNLPVTGEMQRDLYMMAREELTRAAHRVDPRAAERFAQVSRDYSVLAPFLGAARRASAGDVVNSQISATDFGAGLMGGQNDGIAGSLVAIGLNKLRRGYEHGASAPGRDAIARILERNPGALGPSGQALMNAIRRGPAHFGATYYALTQQDPALRQRIRAAQQLMEEEEDQQAPSAPEYSEGQP